MDTFNSIQCTFIFHFDNNKLACRVVPRRIGKTVHFRGRLVLMILFYFLNIFLRCAFYNKRFQTLSLDQLTQSKATSPFKVIYLPDFWAPKGLSLALDGPCFPLSSPTLDEAVISLLWISPRARPAARSQSVTRV